MSPGLYRISSSLLLRLYQSPHSVINDNDFQFHGVVRMYSPGIPTSTLTSPRGPCVTRHSTGVTLYLYRSFVLILVRKINLPPSIIRHTTHNTIRLRQLNTWNNGNRKAGPPKTRNIGTSFLCKVHVIKTLSRYHNHPKTSWTSKGSSCGTTYLVAHIDHIIPKKYLWFRWFKLYPWECWS